MFVENNLLGAINFICHSFFVIILCSKFLDKIICTILFFVFIPFQKMKSIKNHIMRIFVCSHSLHSGIQFYIGTTSFRTRLILFTRFGRVYVSFGHPTFWHTYVCSRATRNMNTQYCVLFIFDKKMDLFSKQAIPRYFTCVNVWYFLQYDV